MKAPDITDKNHPLNVFKSLGKYDPETGFVPYVEGTEVSVAPEEVLVHSKTAKCGSCGGGKVR